MICPKCGAEIPKEARYCPECGALLSEEGAGELGLERDIFSLLAVANLYRVRGLWQEAEAKCIEVLRRYPNNPTAHSLLGDIYADQGRWEEAKQWYEMAVELAPSSQVDIKKLERVKKILEERERATKGKMITWGAVALALMAMLFSVFLFIQWHKPPLPTTSFAPLPPPASTTPTVPLPQGEASPPSLPPPPPAFTPREQNIAKAILDADIPTIRNVNVIIDPSTQTALITIYSDVAFALPDVQAVISRVAPTVLRVAAKADGEIRNFTLRLLCPVHSLPEIAFQGSLPRELIVQLHEQNAFSLFQNPWWHPLLASYPLPSDQ